MEISESAIDIEGNLEITGSEGDTVIIDTTIWAMNLRHIVHSSTTLSHNERQEKVVLHTWNI